MMHQKLNEIWDTMRSNNPTKDHSVTQSFLQRSKPDHYCQDVDDDQEIKLISEQYYHSDKKQPNFMEQSSNVQVNEDEVNDGLVGQQSIVEWFEEHNQSDGISFRDVTQFQSQLIRLQSTIRGYQVWKKYAVKAPVGRFDDSIDIEALLHNKIVNKVREEAGPFNYLACQTRALRLCPEITDNLIKREPFRVQDGPVYVGEWSRELKQRAGKGMQIWADGSVHEGQWARNKAVGLGRLIDADGNLYEGYWLSDEFHGTGRYQSIDGNVYEGEYREGVECGVGTETWPDKSKYEGQYFDGLKEGRGKFFWPDGSSYYGEFRQNNISGYGEYIWASKNVYKGQWKANKMHG